MTGDEVATALKVVVRGTTAHKLEGLRLDFKTEKATAKETHQDLADAAVCFANSSGGTIVVGVHDRLAGSDALVGTDLDADVVRSRVHELTEPHLLVNTQTMVVDGVRLLVCTVPEGQTAYSTSRGHASRRVGSDCVPMRAEDAARLLEERRGVDWSSDRSDVDASQADPLALRRLRSLLTSSARPDLVRLARSGEAQVLIALGLAVPGGRLTRAGALLLGGESIMGIGVVYQHRQTSGGEPDAVLRWDAPLLLAIDELLAAVHARQGTTPLSFADGQQLQVEDFPLAAVREAVVNAVAHGDHRLGRPIHVEHSPQVLRVTSPGPLVSGVTPENILTRGSRSRFPVLATALLHLGLAEALGLGVDRMYREMIRTGRDAPEIADNGDEVSVSFRGQRPDARVARFIASMDEVAREDTDTLLVVRTLCSRRSVTAGSLASVLQRSASETEDVLRRLATPPLGLVEPTIGTMARRMPSYRLMPAVLAALGPAVLYHRRSSSEIDRKVIEHVRDFGEINNRALQRMFDVDVYQARDMLRDLVGREILTRISEQRRGISVRYGPGPRFPSRRKG